MEKNDDSGSDEPFFDTPTQPTLSEFFGAHKKLVDDLSRFDPSHLITSIAGLLTMPEWHASTLRLEVLQHLAVASAQGRKNAKPANFKEWLTELGNGMAGRKEDPSEEVFISRVLFLGQNFLLFEGICEGAAFHLQRFLNILEEMPSSESYAGIKRSVLAILRMSNEAARRAGVSAFQTGQTLPLQSVPNKLVRRINDVGKNVVFSPRDLSDMSVSARDLLPFVFDPSERDRLGTEAFGHTSLERRPVTWFERHACLALPTAISVAVRRLIIEFCVSSQMQGALYKGYANEYAQVFSTMPLLGGSGGPPLRFERHTGILASNVGRYIDKGRLLHICFVLDTFDEYAETGMNGMPDPLPMSEAVQRSISHMHAEFSTKGDFRDAISLVVICPWGRPVSLEVPRLGDGSRWRVEHISAADFEVLSWTSSFSPLSLWRMLDSRDRLLRMNVHVWSLNGLLNLFAWSKSLDGHLIPHAQMPDDHDAEMPLEMMISQNAMLDVRRSGAEAWDLHFARRWDGQSVKVRRQTGSTYFSEDEHTPLYISMDDLNDGKFVAVYEGARISWWVTIETPNSQNRDFSYRLSHALTTWISKR